MSSYFEIEECFQEALAYKQAHSQASLRFLERQFKVPKDRIHHRLKGQNSRSTHSPTGRKLDKEEDLALCWYIESLHCIGVPLCYTA